MSTSVRVASLVLLAAGWPSPAEAWVKVLDQGLPDGESASSVAYDASRDAVVSAGSLGGTFYVAQLDAQASTLLWEQQIPGTAPLPAGRARALVLDGAGDIYVAGRVAQANTGNDFTVVKLSGTDGTLLWSRLLDGGVGANIGADDEAVALALDPAGRVVVAGRLDRGAPSYADVAVLAFDGNTGQTLWEYSLDGTLNETSTTLAEGAVAVVLDPSGDALVAASTQEATSSCNGQICFDMTVLKLSGATGAELWRNGIDHGSEDIAKSLAVDPSGNAVVGGFVTANGRSLAVFELAAHTGGQLWGYLDTQDYRAYSGAHAIEISANGDVYVAGTLDQQSGSFNFAALKLDGLSGGVHWRRTFDGPAHMADDALALSLVPGGDVIVTGRQKVSSGGTVASVRRLTGAFGTSLWHTTVGGPPQPADPQWAGALTLAGDRVVGAGSLAYGNDGEDFAVFSLEVSDGSGAEQPAFLTGFKLLWAEYAVFVWPYRDPKRLALDIARGLEEDVVLRDALWTSRREDVLRSADRTVLLTVPAREEAETLAWLREQLPRLRERRAPLHFFVLEDGEAAARLDGRWRNRSERNHR